MPFRSASRKCSSLGFGAFVLLLRTPRTEGSGIVWSKDSQFPRGVPSVLGGAPASIAGRRTVGDKRDEQVRDFGSYHRGLDEYQCLPKGPN